MLVLLVFFCFLVVLFSSPSRLSLKKKEICILTLIKREKRRKNIKRGSEAASREAASPTCGHVQPSPLRVRARVCAGLLVIEIRLAARHSASSSKDVQL